MATKQLQQALDTVTQWSLQWKMTLSAEKSEVILFTNDNHQAKLQPTLRLNNTVLPYNPSPTFLGVTLDRTLSFRPHVNKVKDKMKKRNQTIKALSGTSWGGNKEDLSIIFRAYSLSCATYCSAAWMSSTSKSILQSLQTCLNEGARIITGCCKGSPEDLTLIEAGLIPLQTTATIAAATAYERARRLPANNPLSHIVTEKIRPRIRKKAWREVGLTAAKEARTDQLPVMPLLVNPPIAPWSQARLNSITFHSTLIEPASKSDLPDRLRDITERTLEALPRPDYSLWTDGSAAEGTRRGGAGIVIFHGEQQVCTISEPAGAATSSYNSEMHAILVGLKWLSNLPVPEHSLALLCSDSLSAITHLTAGPSSPITSQEAGIWTELHNLTDRNIRITFQWDPGHSGILGNELADSAAKDGCQAQQTEALVSFRAAKATITRHFKSSYIASLAPHRVTGRPRPPPH